MLKVNAPYNIAVTRKYFLFLLFFLAFGWETALAAEADPTVYTIHYTLYTKNPPKMRFFLQFPCTIRKKTVPLRRVL